MKIVHLLAILGIWIGIFLFALKEHSRAAFFLLPILTVVGILWALAVTVFAVKKVNKIPSNDGCDDACHCSHHKKDDSK